MHVSSKAVENALDATKYDNNVPSLQKQTQKNSPNLRRNDEGVLKYV